MSQKSVRILLLLGILPFIFILTAGTALAAGPYNIADGDILIEKDTIAGNLSVTVGLGSPDSISITETVNIIGTSTSNVVIIDGTDLNGQIIKIQIEDLAITSSDNSAFSLQNGANVSLILSDDNYLTGGTVSGGEGKAGLNVPEDCKILISSLGNDPESGSLTAIGGSGSGRNGSGSGIGSDGGESNTIITKDSGKINIQNSTITTVGGNISAGGNSSSITIQNSIITATGGGSLGSMYSGGGGSGIGSGGGGSRGAGGIVDSILIQNSTIIVAGGVGGVGISGSNDSGGGSAIGSGGGGAGNHNGGVHYGGKINSIEISGAETNIIAVSGGIGMGIPGLNLTNIDTANVTIKSGNVLILDQPAESNSTFINENDDPIYPISFSVRDDTTNDTKLPGVTVSAGSYEATTRADASGSVSVGTASWYEDGTVTMWLPSNGVTETTFYYAYNSENRTGNELVSTVNADTIGGSFISVYLSDLNLVKESSGGGDGFGNATVVEANTSNSTGGTIFIDVEETEKTVEEPVNEAYDVENPIVLLLAMAFSVFVFVYKKESEENE